MKLHVASTIIASLLFSTAAQAICSSSDLKSNWFATFNLNKPPQEGGCLFDLSDATPDIGNCINYTYDIYTEIVNANWKVQRNCSFQLNATLDNGQKLTAKGKLTADLAYAKGSLSVKGGGSWTGRFEMWDVEKNGLNAQRVPKRLLDRKSGGNGLTSNSAAHGEGPLGINFKSLKD